MKTNTIKYILLVGLLCIALTGNASAVYYNIYDGSGVDTFTHTSGTNYLDTITKRNLAQAPFYYQAYVSGSSFQENACTAGHHSINSDCYGGTAGWDYLECIPLDNTGISYSNSCTGYLVINAGGGYYLRLILGLTGIDQDVTQTVVCSDMPFETGIVGTTCGIDNVTCYINTTGSYIENGFVDLVDVDYYEFECANNTDYKIVFDDAHEYEFTYNGTQITYDYDICTVLTLNFFDRCADPVNEPYIFVWSDRTPLISLMVEGNTWDDWVFGEDVEIGDNINIIISWYDGTIHNIYTVDTSPDTLNIMDIPITYEMGFHTTDNESNDLSGVQVSISQDCGYGGTMNKVSSGGWCWFDECSNSGGSVTVSKAGYKTATIPFAGTPANNAWSYRNSYGITLETVDSVNDTTRDFNDTAVNTSEVTTPDIEYDLDNNNSDIHDGVEIWFVDENGYRTTKISDTDTYVDLWFINKNSAESSMTLEFQRSYTGNYFSDVLDWTVNPNKFGFKRIYNINFTPYYFYYRGNIYNDSLSRWDRIRHLEVANGTIDEEEHYENLTTNLWFWGATIDQKIDHREDVRIVCNAVSNTSALLDLDVELYDNAVLVDYINLTWADFAGATYKWFYEWYPDHDYITGHNYTVKMIGADGYVLRTDHVDCINDDTVRKNKLTVCVKDRSGANLDNCYIYLEGWGSLPTGTTYYNSYEGIDNGYYRYKAAKSGYSGDGWADVTVSDDDEIVWYTLTEDHTNTSATQQKMTDSDIKRMFFPLMFFLLICITFGGFKYVSE